MVFTTPALVCGGTIYRRIAFLLFSLSTTICTLSQTCPSHYSVVDRGPSLVRTLINTPGFNSHGDLAIWHVTGAGRLQGVIFTERGTIDIAGEGKFSVVYPADINEQLTVTGTLQMPQDLRFSQAFKWSDNKMEILQTLGGLYGTSSAINNAGDVVGNAQTSHGTRHAVLWRKQNPIDLGLLAHGDYSSARDINNKGDIVGEANTIPNGRLSAFLWRKGRMRQLPKLAGGTFCSAQALNDHGDIVGSCDLPNGTAHAVIWSDGHVKDLGTLGDDDAPSTALDINMHRQVVGSSEVTEGKLRAFLWEEEQLFDLNLTIPSDSGWLLLAASRINDKGEIAGRGYFEGAIHTFILRPEPLHEDKRNGTCLGLAAKSSP